MMFKEKALVILLLVAGARWSRALLMESGCEGRCNNNNPAGPVQAAFIEQQGKHFGAFPNESTAIGAKIVKNLTKFGSPEGGIITEAYIKQGVNYFESASSRKGEKNAGLDPIKQIDGSDCDPTQDGKYNCTRRSENEDHGNKGTKNGQADHLQYPRNFSPTVIPDASLNGYPSKQVRSEHSGEIGHENEQSVKGRIDYSHDYGNPPLNPLPSGAPNYYAPNQNRPEPFGKRSNGIGEIGNGNTNSLPRDFRNPPLNSLSGGPTIHSNTNQRRSENSGERAHENGEYENDITNYLPRGYGSGNTFTLRNEYRPNKSSSENFRERANGIGESGNGQRSYTPHGYVNQLSGGPSNGYYTNQSGSEYSRERDHGNGESGNCQINYPAPPARQPNEPHQHFAYAGDSTRATGQQYPHWYPGNVASNTAHSSSPGSIYGSGSQQQYYGKYGAGHNTQYSLPSRTTYDAKGASGQQYANIPNTGSFNIASSTIPEQTYGNGQALQYVGNGFQSEVIHELPAQKQLVIVINDPILPGMMPFFYPF